ncbi:hypothetical protein ACWC1D_35705, partial [Streptomyces sp. NPDC001478]
MSDAYYEFGTAAERWERARFFFDAKEYTTAARILTGRGQWHCPWRATMRRGRRARRRCSRCAAL